MQVFLHQPYTIAIRQQWLTPVVSNCMVFNFKYKQNCVQYYQYKYSIYMSKISELKIFVETLHEIGFSFRAICVQDVIVICVKTLIGANIYGLNV